MPYFEYDPNIGRYVCYEDSGDTTTRWRIDWTVGTDTTLRPSTLVCPSSMYIDDITIRLVDFPVDIPVSPNEDDSGNDEENLFDASERSLINRASKFIME